MKEGLTKKQSEKTNLEKGIEDIYSRLEGIPEQDKEKELIKILKEYHIDYKEEANTSGRIKEFIRRKARWPLAAVISLAVGAKYLIPEIKKWGSTPSTTEKNDTLPSAKSTTEKNEVSLSEDIRFDESIYKSLPENGKEIYGYFANYNPTPGRGYAFLDKDSALEYVFNEKNELITKIVAGYGRDGGDDKNTSVELGYDKGKMTTPAGAYLFSNATTEEDQAEYGKMQFSLMGISVRGDKVFLGEHQTYAKHGQLQPRSKKLTSPIPDDNRFSNGCINIDSVDFKKNIQPNFRGDYGELIFVLPDKESKASGVKFTLTEVDRLVKKIMPIIIEMSDKQIKLFQDRIAKTTETTEKNKLRKMIEAIQYKRNAAVVALERKEY